jgi:hypothetical protein
MDVKIRLLLFLEVFHLFVDFKIFYGINDKIFVHFWGLLASAA